MKFNIEPFSWESKSFFDSGILCVGLWGAAWDFNAPSYDKPTFPRGILKRQTIPGPNEHSDLSYERTFLEEIILNWLRKWTSCLGTKTCSKLSFIVNSQAVGWDSWGLSAVKSIFGEDTFFERASWFFVIILKFIFTPIFENQIHEKKILDQKISFSKAKFYEPLSI